VVRFFLFLACALAACGDAFVTADKADAGGGDAGEADSFVPPDGGGDVGSRPSFCSNVKVAFCDDFDDADVEDDWDDTLTVAGGQVSMSSTFVSSPGAAAMRVPSTVNVVDYARGRLVKGFPAQPWVALRLAFELRVDEIPPFPDNSPQVTVASIMVPGVAGFALGFGTDGTFLLYTNDRESPVQRQPIAPELPTTGSWGSYVVDVTRSTTEVRIEVTRNGRKLGELRLPLTTASSLPLALLVGASARHANGAFAVAVDNVTFDIAR
jgi:hypothetical protein